MNLPPAALASLATLAQAAQKVSTPLNPDVEGSFWMPPQASTLAADSDWVFYYIYWVSVIFTSIIVGVMIFFMLRYRHRKGWDGEKSASHGLALEITWSVIPFLLTTVMWWQGFRTYMDAYEVPTNAFEIQVKARQWQWDFVYPNGLTTTDLHIPADRPVVFTMNSVDVIHSFWVPAWRVKKDVVPGRYTKAWVDATEPGIYALFCTEYCGKDHSTMNRRVFVHPTAEEAAAALLADPNIFDGENAPLAQSFDAWYPEAKRLQANKYGNVESIAEIGRIVHTEKGCLACHSLDGSGVVGPSWKGIWGTERMLADGGTALVDENYVRESIYDPQAKVAAGYPPVMATYRGQVTDEEIDGVIALLKEELAN